MKARDLVKALTCCVALLAAAETYAAIPGFGLTYGERNAYVYNEYSGNTDLPRESYFCHYVQAGVTDWFDVIGQYVWYADKSYCYSGVGGALQLVTSDWFNAMGTTVYNWDPGDKANPAHMTYGVTAHGIDLWNGFGYILMTGFDDYVWDSAGHTFSGALYLTYNITDDLMAYAEVLTQPDHVGKTTDVGFGGWYCILRDAYGVQWADLYFDVCNLTEKADAIRVSVGIDFLF